MKYVSIDLEMTGKDPSYCQILQFGAVIEDTRNIQPLDKLPIFNCIVEHERYIGEPRALSMHSEIFEKLAEVQEAYREKRVEIRKKHNILQLNLVAKSFAMWLKNNWISETIDTGAILINVAGKNFGTVDKRFIDLIPGWKESIIIRQRVLDPAILLTDWQKDDTVPNLDKCKKRLGIDGKVTHDALSDALDVIQVLREVTDNYQSRFFGN